MNTQANDYINKGIKMSAINEGIDAMTVFATVEERDAFIALFPKSVKVVASTLSGYDMETSSSWSAPIAAWGVRIDADGVNGGVNETGIKRINKFMAVAKASGMNMTWSMNYQNSITEDQFFAIIKGSVA
jgi:hypothetical protein